MADLEQEDRLHFDTTYLDARPYFYTTIRCCACGTDLSVQRDRNEQPIRKPGTYEMFCDHQACEFYRFQFSIDKQSGRLISYEPAVRG